jgi:beta-N-acetylhexosaminidase
MKRTLFMIFLLLQSSSVLCAGDGVEEYINRMTLPEKVGQLLLLGVQGKSLNREDILHIKKIRPGGIVFYARNFVDAADIPPLIREIQTISRRRELPMLFAIDQEGGTVHRIQGRLFLPPSEPAIGATGSKELSWKVGVSVGNGLRSLRINVNLAPVLDVPHDISSSPMTERSFGSDHTLAERMGSAYVRGLRQSGILATGKHFPGIGRTREDSHAGLPRIIWASHTDREDDIRPFATAIKEGLDIVMVGHVIAEPGDSQNPVSLSSYWMRDVLRRELGFERLILVDNIEMKALGDRMSPSMAAIASLKAGADIIMISHERKTQMVVFNAVVDAVRKGEITPERLNESLRRIVRTKQKMLSDGTTRIRSPDLQDISKLVAEDSVTYLRHKDAPLVHVGEKASVLYTGYNATLFDAIGGFFGHAGILNTTLSNFRKMRRGIPVEDFIREFDALIIDADYPDAGEIIALCNELNKDYVVILSRPSRVERTLATLRPKRLVITFENYAFHYRVAAEIIGGMRQARGRLPYALVLPPDLGYAEQGETE